MPAKNLFIYISFDSLDSGKIMKRQFSDVLKYISVLLYDSNIYFIPTPLLFCFNYCHCGSLLLFFFLQNFL